MFEILSRKRAIKSLIVRDKWIKRNPGSIWPAILQLEEFLQLNKDLGSQLLSFATFKLRLDKNYIINPINRDALDDALIEINKSISKWCVLLPSSLIMFFVLGFLLGKGILSIMTIFFVFVLMLVVIILAVPTFRTKITGSFNNWFSKLINVNSFNTTNKLEDKKTDDFLSKH